MKNTLKYGFVAAISILALSSCSNDDSPRISGHGELKLEFDQAYGGNDLGLGAAQLPNPQNEILTINTVKYIVGNIVLIKSDGTSYTLPDDYFIVDEANELSHEIELQDIPAGDYVAVRFGIGVTPEQYNLGQAAQGPFGQTATAAGLLADWNVGYNFFWIGGSFTSPTVTAQTPFEVKTRKTSLTDNYLEVTLDFPSTALVRQTIAPTVHIIADLSKALEGDYHLKLSDHVSGGAAIVTDDLIISAITENLANVFSVNHIHNDPHEH